LLYESRVGCPRKAQGVHAFPSQAASSRRAALALLDGDDPVGNDIPDAIDLVEHIEVVVELPARRPRATSGFSRAGRAGVREGVAMTVRVLGGDWSHKLPRLAKDPQAAFADCSMCQRIVVTAPDDDKARIPFVISRSSVQVRAPAPFLLQ